MCGLHSQLHPRVAREKGFLHNKPSPSLNIFHGKPQISSLSVPRVSHSPHDSSSSSGRQQVWTMPWRSHSSRAEGLGYNLSCYFSLVCSWTIYFASLGLSFLVRRMLLPLWSFPQAPTPPQLNQSLPPEHSMTHCTVFALTHWACTEVVDPGKQGLFYSLVVLG